MPLPLAPLLIGGGLSLAGSLASFLSPSGEFSAESVTPDLSGLQGQADQLRDPNFGLQQFLRLAQQSVPGQDDFFSILNTLGGSTLDAEAQFEQARAGANEQALGAQGQFSLNAQGQAGNILQFIASLQQQAQIASAQSRQSGAQNKIDIFNQLASAGSSLAGFGLGGGNTNTGGQFGGQQNPGLQQRINDFNPLAGPNIAQNRLAQRF